MDRREPNAIQESAPTIAGLDSKPHSEPDLERMLFRAEAVRAHANPSLSSNFVRFADTRVEPAFWMMIAMFVAVILALWFVSIPDYASGRGFITRPDSVELTTGSSGQVVELDVRSGEYVAADQVLVRLDASEAQSVVDNLRTEYRHQQVSLIDTNDEARELAALDQIQTALRPAEARLRAKAIRAPRGGYVYNIRVRDRLFLNSGDPVLSLTTSLSSFELVGLLPGRFAPLLQSGQRMRLYISGYSHAWIDASLQKIGDAVVTPVDVGAMFGGLASDLAPRGQSLIVVKAELSRDSFTSDAGRHRLIPGLDGNVDIEIQRQRLALVLWPGLANVVNNPLGRM